MNCAKKRIQSLFLAAAVFLGSIGMLGAAPIPHDTAENQATYLDPILPLSFSSAEHLPTCAEILFNQPIAEADGYLEGAYIRAYRGEDANSQGVTEVGGRPSWEIANSSIQDNMFLYLNVDDFYLQNKNLSLIVTVDYFDEGTGSFMIQYDRYNSNFAQGQYTNSDTVKLTNSGQWKTAEFVLDQAYLMNRQAIKGAPAQDVPYKRSADLRIRSVQGNIKVSGVTLREAVELTGISQESVGNIFTTNDTPVIPLMVYNSTDINRTFSVRANIKSTREVDYGTYDGIVELDPATAAKGPIAIQALPKGAYYLYVTVVDSTGKTFVTEKIPFSILTPKDGQTDGQPYFGVQTHLVRKVFETNPQVVDNVLHAAELAGAEIIRDEMYWGMAEPVKDQFVFLPHWDQYVDTALEKGMETSLILSYGNELYREEGDVGGTPTPGTDSMIAAFANYAREMATHYKGKIKQYEVWNEWNGGMNNRPADNATGRKYESDVYTKLLKATYTAIKEVDPEARVVGSVSAGANPFYIESVVAAGGLDYMDAVSYHPYNYPSVPDRMSSEVSTFEGLRKISAILKRYGSEKPLIISEQGWPTYQENYAASIGVPERYQASYISRLFTLGLAYGAEQVIIYDLQDDGTFGAREQNFGMIEHWYGDEVSYAAKESLVAMNNLTEVLDDVEFVKEYSVNQDLRVYQFTRPKDQMDVAVLWGVYNGHRLSYLGNTAGMTAYDMFGNVSDKTYVGTDPVFLIGPKGSFNIDEVVTPRWYSVAADASHNIEGTTGASTYSATSYLSSAPWYEGITLQTSGGFEVPEFIQRGTRKGWILGKESYQDNTVYADVDEAYLSASQSEVKIRIEYFDEAIGEFYVWYDGVNGETLAGTVSMNGTKEWKQAEFQLSDGWFAGGIDGHDIKLSLKTGDTYGCESLVFGRLEVERVSADLDFGRSGKQGMVLENSEQHSLAETAGRQSLLLAEGKNASAGFNVENTFIHGGATDLQVEVVYYDSGTLESNSMEVFFDGGKSAGEVALTGSNQWKEAVFPIAQAQFQGKEDDGSDFKISMNTSGIADSSDNACLPISSVRVIRMKPSSGHAVLGETVASEYLEIMPSGNAGFATTPSFYSTSAGRTISTMQTNKAKSSPNLFLLVNDEFLYNTDVTAELQITFWDEGTGNLLVNYDSFTNKDALITVTGAFKNTQDFQTVTVELPRARFFNRRAQKSDIQISRNNGNVAVSELLLQIKGNEATVPTPTAQVYGENQPNHQNPTIQVISPVVNMDVTPPDQVKNLMAMPSVGGAYLSWENPPDGTGDKATMEELRVYQQLEDSTYQLVNYKMDSPANNPEGLTGLFYIGGLENGKEYRFKVTALDKWLNESVPQFVNVTPGAAR